MSNYAHHHHHLSEEASVALALEELAKAHSRQRPTNCIVLLDATDIEDEGDGKMPSTANGFMI